MRAIIHEMRNHLAVAVANVEAFVDGKLEPTPTRLRNVLEVLHQLDALIDDVRPAGSLGNEEDPPLPPSAS